MFKINGVLLIVLCYHGLTITNAEHNNLSTRLEKIGLCKRSTNFLDLSVECKWLIMEQLSLAELLTVCESNEQLASSAEGVFRRKYGRKQFILPTSKLPISSNNDRFQENAENIRVYDFESAIQILKYFGHLIKNIRILADYSAVRHQTIFKAMHSYCSDSLTDFSWDYVQREFFTENMTFVNVERVSLVDSATPGEFDMNKIFPSMSTLELHIISSDLNLSKTYRRLENLHIYQTALHGELADEMAARLIHANPQLKMLSLTNSPVNVLSGLAEATTLDRLELEYFEERSDNFEMRRFGHLKVLKLIGGRHYSMPGNLIFDSVDEFETDGYAYKCNRWFDFIRNHNELKHLRVIRDLENSEVLELSSAKPNVVEMSLKCAASISKETIGSLLGNCSRLQTMHIELNSIYTTINIAKHITDTLGTQWIVDHRDYFIEITRK